MLKRLIEVALPLKEVSEQSAREKSIRHGHISTLHIWWARRPLAACRAVVFASLIPDPDDPDCPEGFRKLVSDLLGEGNKKAEFRPKNGDGSAIADTPRNRCLEFIKLLVRWENSNNPEYIEPARKLIAAAHKFLHPGAEGDAPKVLDPFAGGGAIPLEALRLGCEAHALDLNPVAHLIELCTIVYPQEFGQPDSRPVPDYIKRLISKNRAKKKAKGADRPLLDRRDVPSAQVVALNNEITPDVEITEAEYWKNPLAADVKYWGHWVLEAVRRELLQYYPTNDDGTVPAAFLWARTIACPNPSCGAVLPLIKQLWLCKKARNRVAMKMVPNPKTRKCEFVVVEGREIDFDPDTGTMLRGSAACPFCHQVAPVKHLRQECKGGRMSQQLMVVVSSKKGRKGKHYRAGTPTDEQAFQQAARALQDRIAKEGEDIMPIEPIPCYDPRRVSPPLYGLNTFASLFNERQLLIQVRAAHYFGNVHGALRASETGEAYARAVVSYLAFVLNRGIESNTTLGRWIPAGEKPAGAFGRQAIPMVWDYCEINPLDESPRQLADGIKWVTRCLTNLPINSGSTGYAQQGSATAIPFSDSALAAVITDPPYYDAVPYSALSDFFYVWLRRSIGEYYPDNFRTKLTPKQHEIVEQRAHRALTNRKDAAFYERMMGSAFLETRRVLNDSGICAVMFAHKTTTAWETLISGLIHAGITVVASWPLHTEKPGRMNSLGTASLASSVTLICRKRLESAGDALWDDVRMTLNPAAKERLDFFWSQNIRGADFFISAIGPALSVFGKYERVTKLSGEEVTVGQFLDEVRGLVTNYALTKIMKTTHTANIDPDSRFYVVWKWSYGEAKVPADESFKMAQALGMDTETMWDRTGVLEKSGENVAAVPVAKRMKVKDLGDPAADGAPASLIDVLHRLCAFREKGDTKGMAEFLGHSGQGQNSALWVLAQAISEILPDGDKEKQLMQGLLNQKDQLEEAQGRLF
jgi:putative DNA methylase